MFLELRNELCLARRRNGGPHLGLRRNSIALARAAPRWFKEPHLEVNN